MTTLQPLNDQILIRRQEPETMRNEIFIPESAQKKSMWAEAAAVGPGKLNGKGQRLPMGVKEGDTILIPYYSGVEVEVDGESFAILREGEVMGVREGEPESILDADSKRIASELDDVLARVVESGK